ncbi:MAG: NAD-dependent epimerase/dehydratase family protein [Pirellulaceae bacterium]|nr:NAD-dependent epimerase/dehydratase family protein [Pirellulaceae bacterium]
MIQLVTGASGFVGSHLVQHLCSLGKTVRALVRRPEAKVGLRNKGVLAVSGDVCDRTRLCQVVRGADVIYHCAAASSLCSDDEIRRTNLDGTRNLLHAVRTEGAGRIVFISSLNALGSTSYENATESAPVIRSGEVHADVKIDSEQLALQFGDTHDIEVTILRPGLIYGPGERYIPKLAKSVQNGTFRFIGSRENVVPLIYVHDMVRLMVAAACTGTARGKIYHATDGSRTTIGDLVDTLADLNGSARPRHLLPYFVPRLACSMFEQFGKTSPISRTALRFLGTSRHVNMDLAKRELGFQPYVNLQEGLHQTVHWMQQEHLTPETFRRAA